MRVDVEISQEELEGDYSGYVSGLRLTCDRCGHEVTVFGTTDRSAKRGAVMLSEECPNGENNYYDVEDWV
jgi:hypothetical protein